MGACVIVNELQRPCKPSSFQAFSLSQCENVESQKSNAVFSVLASCLLSPARQVVEGREEKLSFDREAQTCMIVLFFFTTCRTDSRKIRKNFLRKDIFCI